ncbi:Adenylate cyclase, class 3 [Reichenbachiella agariperforans]|uniref:Adenylate cyclase, class 3 n=1 Tax=Reichenbachiella agariperforans TaxID=156994 RepID=A0A1M6KA57_REIAG|nr:adenylate/guanylate cyclase domain-containing protein [Reichenbachiella agariperforans]SHJ55819.1 Adenylate cyclase, class 3 [Reichenbachiella agariperforans]
MLPKNYRGLVSISIQSKLTVIVVLVSIVSTLIVSLFSYNKAKNAIVAGVYDQLTSLRTSREYHIDGYFASIKDQVEYISKDSIVSVCLRDLGPAFEDLNSVRLTRSQERKLDAYYDDYLDQLEANIEIYRSKKLYVPKQPVGKYLQYQYIANNPYPTGQKEKMDRVTSILDYDRIAATVHNRLKNFMSEMKFYDVLLMDTEGNVVYTVKKEPDFATNLKEGPYSSSNLGHLVQEILDNKDIHGGKFVDFELYRPSLGTPSSFVAAPVYSEDDFVGIIALQMPISRVNQIMSAGEDWEDDGLGKTGEIYLVGSDYLMRNDARMLLEDSAKYLKTIRKVKDSDTQIKMIERFGTSVFFQNINTEASREALSGVTNHKIVENFMGEDVLSSYAPFEKFGLHWAIIAEQDESEGLSELHRYRQFVIIILVVAIILFTAIGMLSSSLFTRPIFKLIESARRISEGDLTAKVKIQTFDEYEVLAKSFNTIADSVRDYDKKLTRLTNRFDTLVSNLMPDLFTERWKAGEQDLIIRQSNVTVLYADITGFTALSRERPPHESIKILNDLVESFDSLGTQYDIEKVTTIGDNYLAVSGVETPKLDHNTTIVNFALEMRRIVRQYSDTNELKLGLAVAVNSGDVFAGIVGRKKLKYDVWGEAVNTANFLSDFAEKDEILVSESIYENLVDIYEMEEKQGVKGLEGIKVWNVVRAINRDITNE